MSKPEAVSFQPDTFFERRRRVRRMRMIVDVTTKLIEFDDSLTHREARSLVECARKAIEELFPDLGNQLDATLLPKFERILRSRWPLEEAYPGRELIN